MGREKNKVIRALHLWFFEVKKNTAGGRVEKEELRKIQVKSRISKKDTILYLNAYFLSNLVFQTFLWENERLGAAGNGEEREEGTAGIL